MNCSPYDLKDFFFGELPAGQRSAVEQHIDTCEACRHELSGLKLTQTALLSVSEMEPPRRIAFVSDKLFEPSWWQRFWRSAPRLGFASAAMLAAALLVHGFLTRPQPAPAQVAAGADSVSIEKAVQAEVAKRLNGVVTQAVAASEQRQNAKLLQAVDTRIHQSERRVESGLLEIRDYLRYEQKLNALTRRAAFRGDVQ
jgi:anti-sigma factor RsiW